MFALFSTSLLGLALLATPDDSVAQAPPLPTCETGVRHIELAADAPGRPLEVCIHSELSTSLFFDAKLARVDLEKRERFRWVLVGDNAVTLIPSEALPNGERVPVTVYFEDSAAPASATFLLVVHPTQAEGQVMVSRHARTLASYRQGEQQARAEVQQCREEKERLQAECGNQGGLTGLIINGWMGEQGVVAQVLMNVTSRPGDLLVARKVISYRAVGPKGQGRVAVEVELFNPPGMPSWTLTRAALVDSKREIQTEPKVWPLKPILPGTSRRIVVEMDATEIRARSTFTLKLWAGEDGAGSVSLDGVTFP